MGASAASVCLSSAKYGQFGPQPGHVFPKLGPSSVHAAPKLVQSGRTRPESDRCGPMSGKSRSDSTTFGQSRGKVVRPNLRCLGPGSARVRQNSDRIQSKFNRSRTNSGQIRPNLGVLRPIRPEFARSWSMLTKFGPASAQFSPIQGAVDRVGEIRATCGDVPTQTNRSMRGKSTIAGFFQTLCTHDPCCANPAKISSNGTARGGGARYDAPGLPRPPTFLVLFLVAFGGQQNNR